MDMVCGTMGPSHNVHYIQEVWIDMVYCDGHGVWDNGTESQCTLYTRSVDGYGRL